MKRTSRSGFSKKLHKEIRQNRPGYRKVNGKWEKT